MAVLTQPSIPNPRNVMVGNSPTTARPELTIGEPARYSSDRMLRIVNALQSSLDVGQVIETFAQEVRLNVPIDGVRFQNSALELELKSGRNGAHACAYRLSVNDQLLGEVTFTRRSKFSTVESNELELLLCSLVHPLRNALLYRSALLKGQRDPLTGVYNRAAFNETLAREVERAQRHKTPLSLIVFDIDHFKTINDTYGHATGDCLLKGLAESACSGIRRCDMLFRYGGEEFVVVLNNTDEKGAARLAERIRRNIEKEEYACGGELIRMTVSAGVASLLAKDTEARLFERADQALYRAKSDGRNCVRAPE